MDPVTLVQENRRLKQLVARYREQVRRLSTRNQSLLRTVNELAREEEILEDEDHDVPMEENDEENQGVANWQNENEDEGEHVNSNRPMWDSNDCVLRCRDCSWEVLDGMCQHPGCLKEHDIPDDFSDSQEEEATFFDGITSTLSAAELAERVLAPRGETPSPSVDIRQGDIPPQYSFSPAQRESYQELRQRGATHQMCTTFSMRFKKEVGIIAVLTPEIKETFAGPAMLPEHEWELWLGREVRLDPEDEDGSDFIIGLLEDVLLFSGNHFTRRSLMWETVRTVNLLQATIWATRPTGTLLAAFGSPGLRERADTKSSLVVDSTSDEDERARDPADRLLKKPFVESGPTIYRDEYELTDVEALETDDDGDDDVADLGYVMNPRYDDFNWSDGEDDGLYGSEDEREVADAERFAHADVSQAEGDVQMKIEEDEAAGRITGSYLAGPSHGSQTVVDSDAEIQDDEEPDSPVDSDFDEDEVLSGDEDVLQGIGRGPPPAVP